MLAIQANRRPAFFTEYMAARELDRRLQPLSDFQYDEDKTTSRELKDLYLNTREAIQPLERLLQNKEKAPLNEALNMIQVLNSIARSTEDTFATLAAIEGFSANVTNFREKLQALYKAP